MVKPANGRDTFEDTLSRRLGAAPSAPGPDCLDAEMLAAFYERTLPGDQRAQCETHLADCARCQTSLAALVRADVPVARESRWWAPAWSVDWRIAAPALAAVLVLAVAVTQMRSHVTFAPPAELASARLAEMRLQQAARARAAETERPAAPPTVGELAMSEASRAQPGGVGGGEAATESAPLSEPAAKAESRAVSPQRMAAMAKERATVREMIASRSGAVAAAPTTGNAVVAPAAPSAPIPPAGASTAQAPQAPASASSGAVNGTAVGATTIGGAAASAPASGAAGEMARFGAVSPQFIVRAPDGVARWHVRVGDQVDYTPDGLNFYGSTTGVAAPLTAGSAPAASVCWMVGRAGAVIRTIDGTHWTRLSSPTGADLSGVKAESADTATVTDINGGNYTTSDGGRTWSPK